MESPRERLVRTEWWRDDDLVHRFVCDLIAGELSLLRHASVASPPSPWSATMHLGHDLGVDSIELVAIATALSESLHLHESGVEDHLLARRTIGDWSAVAQTGLASYSSTMTFRTSGSTGEPKRCTHSLAALWQEVDALASLIGERERVLSAVRSHHIYGFLFTVLLPRALGVPGASVIDVRHRLPSSLCGELRAGDLVIGYPDVWRAVASQGRAIPRGVVGTTSTAPCPDAVAHGATRAGLDRLVQVYGSSETAGVGTRDDPASPYALLPQWERSRDDAMKIVRRHPDGARIPVAPPDTLEWVDERHFRPAGRIDHAVQVAGVNVFPGRVREVLMEHPGVRDAAVRPMHIAGAQRLKAFVVLQSGWTAGAAIRTALEEWTAARLSGPECPRAFAFGEAIPTDASGKLMDWPHEISRSDEPESVVGGVISSP